MNLVACCKWGQFIEIDKSHDLANPTLLPLCLPELPLKVIIHLYCSLYVVQTKYDKQSIHFYNSFFSDECYINGTNGNQLVYNHSEIIDTGRCNVSKCIDGVIEEEFKYPYMIYCETDSTKKCQVIGKKVEVGL